MKRICFLILHYKTLKDTISCIHSIQALAHEGMLVEIYIIDNGSGDRSYEELKRMYKGNSSVFVYSTGENLGFSKGNNWGFQKIHNKHGIDFLIMCNNDVLFEDPDFLYRLCMSYDYCRFDVLGPDIVEPYSKKLYGQHRNPVDPIENSETGVKIRIGKLKNKISVYNPDQFQLSKHEYILNQYRWYLFKVRQILKYQFSLRRKTRYYQTGVCLYGCCIIFSADYIKTYKKLLEPETFIYLEEQFLYQKVLRDHKIINYDPSLKVVHLAGRATKSHTQNKRKDTPKKDLNLCWIESLELYLKFLKINHF